MDQQCICRSKEKREIIFQPIRWVVGFFSPPFAIYSWLVWEKIVSFSKKRFFFFSIFEWQQNAMSRTMVRRGKSFVAIDTQQYFLFPIVWILGLAMCALEEGGKGGNQNLLQLPP